MANIPISSFTAAANATGIGMSGFSLTGSNAQSMLDLAGTWNTSGTPTGLKLNVTDTASNAASLLMDLQTGGSSIASVRKNGIALFGPTAAFVNGIGVGTPALNVGAGANVASNFAGGQVNVWDSNINVASLNSNGVALRSAATVAWGSGTSVGSPDTILVRDAANTVAQRNGVNAQTLRVYETFTDASNYSRMNIVAGTNFDIQSQAAGTGTPRNIRIFTSGSNAVQFGTAGTIRWEVSVTGHFLAQTDNTSDIGASAASRPRDLWLARNADVRGSVYIGGFVELLGISAGVVCLRQFATSDFNRLQFGGTTASFPSIQRNGNELRLRLADDSGFCPVRVSQVGFNGATSSFPMLSNNGATLQTKLADDSAFAPHAMQYLDVTDGVTAPGAGTGRARIYVDTADGDLKVVFADGVVKTLATDT